MLDDFKVIADAVGDANKVKKSTKPPKFSKPPKTKLCTDCKRNPAVYPHACCAACGSDQDHTDEDD